MDEAVIESHDISSADRQGMTSILWENAAKLFDATSIAGSLNAHLDSFCDGVAASPREYLVRRAAKNVISRPQNPPQPPPKKQQCKNQECLASYKKLIACARVRCKRRVDSVAASPREYLVRRAAKNVISPPQKPPPRNNNEKIKSVLQVTRRS